MAQQRTLDRRVHFDPRSRNYPIRTAGAPTPPPRTYSWTCDTVLDQGREGACVGFAVAHELRARPVEVKGVNNALAMRLYHRARQLDPWPGEDYEGTAVIAGVQAAQELGHLREYRWAFGVDDLAYAVSYQGPAVLGIPWYESMYETKKISASSHKVVVDGQQVGGHAILCRGFSRIRNAFKLHNSWGPGWGVNGAAWIDWNDMRRLLQDDGEACIPIVR